MTVAIKTGDLLGEDAEAIVNTVNCVGVMGKGIALQFKQKWPENFRAYERACRESLFRHAVLRRTRCGLGTMLTTRFAKARSLTDAVETIVRSDEPKRTMGLHHATAAKSGLYLPHHRNRELAEYRSSA